MEVSLKAKIHFDNNLNTIKWRNQMKNQFNQTSCQKYQEHSLYKWKGVEIQKLAVSLLFLILLSSFKVQANDHSLIGAISAKPWTISLSLVSHRFKKGNTITVVSDGDTVKDLQFHDGDKELATDFEFKNFRFVTRTPTKATLTFDFTSKEVEHTGVITFEHEQGKVNTLFMEMRHVFEIEGDPHRADHVNGHDKAVANN